MSTDRTKWLLVMLGFVALGLAFSTRSFLSLSMVEWEREFGWSKSTISGGGAIGLILMAIVAPFVGHAVDKYGPRSVLTIGMGIIGVGSVLVASMQSQSMFFFSYSIFSAIGFGAVSMHVVATAIAPVFDKNRGLATGIASGGATGGQLLFVPLFSLLLSIWGWRAGYIAMGVTTLAAAVIFWITLRQIGGKRRQFDTERVEVKLMKSMKVLLTNRAFHALFWSFMLCGFTTAGVIETHLLPYAAICGYGPIVSATAFGVLSAFNLLGMILAGYLSDRINGVVLLFAIYMLRAASFILLLYIGLDIKLLFAFSVFFGLFDYSTVPVTANLIARHLGLQSMGLAMGMLATGHALGAAFGAWVGGIIFDILSSYYNVWISSIGLAILSALLVLIIPHKKEQSEYDSAERDRHANAV